MCWLLQCNGTCTWRTGRRRWCRWCWWWRRCPRRRWPRGTLEIRWSRSHPGDPGRSPCHLGWKWARLLSSEFCGICARWDSHCANSWLAFCKNMGTKYVHLLFGPWVLAVKLQEVRQGRCMRSLTFAVLSKSLKNIMSLTLRDCFDIIWSHKAWILYNNLVLCITTGKSETSTRQKRVGIISLDMQNSLPQNPADCSRSAWGCLVSALRSICIKCAQFSATLHLSTHHRQIPKLPGPLEFSASPIHWSCNTGQDQQHPSSRSFAIFLHPTLHWLLDCWHGVSAIQSYFYVALMCTFRGVSGLYMHMTSWFCPFF